MNDNDFILGKLAYISNQLKEREKRIKKQTKHIIGRMIFSLLLCAISWFMLQSVFGFKTTLAIALLAWGTALSIKE